MFILFCFTHKQPSAIGCGLQGEFFFVLVNSGFYHQVNCLPAHRHQNNFKKSFTVYRSLSSTEIKFRHRLRRWFTLLVSDHNVESSSPFPDPGPCWRLQLTPPPGSPCRTPPMDSLEWWPVQLRTFRSLCTKSSPNTFKSTLPQGFIDFNTHQGEKLVIKERRQRKSSISQWRGHQAKS